MTRYDVILLVFVVFFAAFAGYFGYREYTDPILFPGGEEQTAAPEPEKEPEPDVLTSLPEVRSPKPEPTPEPEMSAPSLDPEELESSVEEALTKQVGQLAALMENQLSASLESAQDRISGQSEKLAAVNEIVGEALMTYQENTRLSMEELSDTLSLIDEMQGESEAITSGLESARTEWDQLFDDVTAIDQRSGDRLDEANFEFQTYTISGAETLPEIANRLEAEYNLPESDLSFLLNRFNDIEYRLHVPGGRRAAYRVVANDSLRVPVPKTAGTILSDYALPEKLRSQVAHINQAASANASLRKNLSTQVRKLKQLEAGVQAIASMSETLARIDLSTDTPLPDDSDLSPELQEAWQRFESAAADFRSASGYEEEQLARERLKQAISNLLETYEQDSRMAPDTESNPLEYYLRFIEKYRPGKSGL
jgi:hypothetical protein